MKALTIWQPWASLIMLGVKPYEFRSWPAHKSIQGQRIVIHAGARKVKPPELRQMIQLLQDNDWKTGLKPEALPHLQQWLEAPNKLWLGAALGTARMLPPVPAHDISREFGGNVNDSDREQHANWAWPMADPISFDPPVPCRGAQGFWNWGRE